MNAGDRPVVLPNRFSLPKLAAKRVQTGAPTDERVKTEVRADFKALGGNENDRLCIRRVKRLVAPKVRRILPDQIITVDGPHAAGQQSNIE